MQIFSLYSGIGNELHQYYLDSTNQTIHKEICLNFRSKVYGIAAYTKHHQLYPQFVVVNGGKELAILILCKDKQLQLVKCLELNDWISSVQVYEPTASDEISLCVVSAHSVASEFNVNINGKWKIQNKSTCVDKCTLYCSHIIGNRWDKTIIFGGTAFGELIIWQANGNGSVCEVLHRLCGHNVIEI